MPSFLQSFNLIVWKNLRIRKHNWKLTLTEVILPVLLFVFIEFLNIELQSDTSEWVRSVIAPIEPMTQLMLLRPPSKKDIVAYAPSNEFTDMFMERVRVKIGWNKKVLVPCSSENNISSIFEDKIVLRNKTRSTFLGLSFVGDFSLAAPPPNLIYKVRMPLQRSTWVTVSDANEKIRQKNLYVESGFIVLQWILDATFIEIASNHSEIRVIMNMQEFPYPAHMERPINHAVIMFYVPMMTVLSFATLSPSIIRKVVEEKQTGVQAIMKMMGLKSWMMWLGWMVNYLIVNIFSITIIVLLLSLKFGDHAEEILKYSSSCLVWIYLYMYLSASIMFCIFISSFFSRPTIAMACGLFIWLLTYYFPLLIFTIFPNIINYDAFFLPLAILPNVGLQLGFYVVSFLEVLGEGLRWDNLFKTEYQEFVLSLILFIFDVFFYGFLTWYVENVKPGHYGIAKPWYFIFPCFRKKYHEDDLNAFIRNEQYFEEVPEDHPVGIKIRKLSKSFHYLGNLVLAIDNISLDIYDHEITALLGYNGAGKSTLLALLTGLFSPTKGSVFIRGINVRKNISQIKKKIGFCPQENVLFEELTVMEHLLFFAMLKDVEYEDAKIEALNMLQSLNMFDKQKCMPSVLSGGMKRKLSIAIALMGESNVLVLDEPTIGVDIETKRSIWNIIQNVRGQCTTVIATNSMEEADGLCDRIVMMSHGRVFCFGSPKFLKNLFGSGYRLYLIKEYDCNAAKVDEVVKFFVPEAELRTEGRTQLQYILPADKTNAFPALFDYLEVYKNDVGIERFDLTFTTLSDVFLKFRDLTEEYDSRALNEIFETGGIGEARDSEDQTNIVLPKKRIKSRNVVSSIGELSFTDSETLKHFEETAEKATGFVLLIKQCTALIKKKVLSTYRNLRIVIFEVLLAAMLSILSAFITMSPRFHNDRAVTISVESYRGPPVLYHAVQSMRKLGAMYAQLISGSARVKFVNTSAIQGLLEEASQDLFSYQYFKVAAEFRSVNDVPNITALYSGFEDDVTAAFSLNFLTNTLLQYFTRRPDCTITTINYPIDQYTPANSVNLHLIREQFWGLIIGVGLLLVVCSYVIALVTERVSYTKQLQLTTGITKLTYYFCTFVWDFTCYLLVTVISLLIAFLVNSGIMVSEVDTAPDVLLLILLGYGLSGILMTYVMSYTGNKPVTAYSFTVVFNLIIGVVFSFPISLIDTVTGERTKLMLPFNIICYAALTYALTRYSNIVISNNECTVIPKDTLDHYCNEGTSMYEQCCDNLCKRYNTCHHDKHYLTGKSNIAPEVFSLFTVPLLYILILIVIEGNYYRKLKFLFHRRITSKKPKIQMDIFDDVVQEEKIVSKIVPSPKCSLPPGTVALLIHNLGKKYGKFFAVRSVTLKLDQGECIGILGENGAGKSTLYSMLTGITQPSKGNAYNLYGNLRYNKQKYLSHIGYCPQFSACMDYLTGREMLYLFAHLRGIANKSIQKEVNKWLHIFCIQEHSNKYCRIYSGGTKRKLSIAIALIGDPPIIILDEPTTGIDPISKRNLIELLKKCLLKGQAILLTTHSVDDCEQICNRLAIMNDGRFICVGRLRDLKDKYAQGFIIIFKLILDCELKDASAVKEDSEKTFTHITLLQEDQINIQYHVMDLELSWSQLFSSTEAIKSRHAVIGDYIIYRTNLEHVFLTVPLHQNVVQTKKNRKYKQQFLKRLLRRQKKQLDMPKSEDRDSSIERLPVASNDMIPHVSTD